MGFNIWKYSERKPLPDILSFIVDNRGKTVPTDPEGNHILIATNCVRNENLYPSYEKIRTLNEDTYQNWFRAHPIPGDILFVCKGTPGRCCMVPDPVDFCIAQDMVALRCDDKTVYNKYLLAVLRSNEFQTQITNTSVGDVIPHFKKSFFNQLLIPIPPFEVQKAIGDAYYKFTEKQELNKKINENLQEQAKAIYSKMIIEDADESWTPGVLSDIAIITMGQSPKGDTYNEDGVGTVFFQGRAEFGFRFPTRRLSTTDPKRMAQTNDALMSVRAPVGDMNVAYENCCIGRGLAAIRSKDDHQSFVLYTLFDLRDELNVFNSEGTVFGSINRDALNSMPISIPPRRVMDEFEVIVSPIDAAIRNNYDEICRLEAIRDNILPRLMSGELEVSDLDL